MRTVDCSISTDTTWQLMSLHASKETVPCNDWKKGPLILVFNKFELNKPFKFDNFWQGTKSVDDFRIQYVGIFNKGGILYS